MKRQPNQVPASLKTINVKALLRKRGIYLKLRANKEMKKLAMPIAREMIKGRKKIVKTEPRRYLHFTNEQAQAYWEKQIHIVEVIEQKFDLKIQQFVMKMVNGFLTNLESEITTKSLVKFKGYFDDNTDELLVDAQLDFAPLLADQALLSGQEAMKLIGSKEIYLPGKLRETIAENIRKFTLSMIETDRDKLVDIITHGIEAGKSVPEIRSQIQTDFEITYSKSQAQRITRTEVLRVSNEASLDAYEQSGVVEGKQWLTAGAVDECADYEGQIESLGDSFYGDTSEFADGDPPLHPNCRCVLLPVLIGEKGIIPDTKALRQRIVELEAQADKRTKGFKQLKAEKADDAAYIKSLEKYLGADDDS